MNKWEMLGYGVGFYIIVFIITKQFFNFIFRGFAPFTVSRPWVLDQLLGEVESYGLRNGAVVYSIGTGRSGFLHVIEKNHPTFELVGIERDLMPFILSYVQALVQRSKIKVRRVDLRRIDVSRADVIYIKLDLSELRGLDKKLKFECKPGAKVFSNGFVIPGLPYKKILELDSRKGRYSFFAKDRELFKLKSKKSKKANKIYVYEI